MRTSLLTPGLVREKESEVVSILIDIERVCNICNDAVKACGILSETWSGCHFFVKVQFLHNHSLKYILFRPKYAFYLQSVPQNVCQVEGGYSSVSTVT